MADEAEEATFEAHDVIEGLMREYLAKRGLEKTAKAFEKESPRGENAISNRNTLRKALALERLCAKLKKKNPTETLPSTLEILVSETMRKGAAAAPAPTSHITMPAAKKTSEPTIAASKKTTASDLGPPPRPRVGSWGMDEDGPATAGKVSTAPAAKKPAAFDDDDLALLERSADLPAGGASHLRSKAPAPVATSSRPTPRAGFGFDDVGGAPPKPPPRASTPQENLDMEEFDEFDEDDLAAELAELEAVPQTMNAPTVRVAGQAPRFSARDVTPSGIAAPLPPGDAAAAKTLLFGQHGGGRAPPSWSQGFFFNDVKGLSWGLVQRDGGPCGVLASVQAHMLDALLSDADGSEKVTKRMLAEPTKAELEAALAAALVMPLALAAGTGGSIKVVSCGEASTKGLSIDHLLMRSRVHMCKTVAEAEREVKANLKQLMEPQGCGLLLLLMSAILTKGVDKCKAEMDEPDNGLMAMHGYCSQDLVNLLMTGQCVSNVFDGEKDFGGMKMRGIQSQGRIGLLSLFEWYGSLEVGKRLKEPKGSVWVVCSESHFSTLFRMDGVSGTSPVGSKLNLGYYDGLSRQDAPITLTVSPDPAGGHTASAPEPSKRKTGNEAGGALVPPLEYVIETRWPGVAVDWNGSDPIL